MNTYATALAALMLASTVVASASNGETAAQTAKRIAWPVSRQVLKLAGGAVVLVLGHKYLGALADDDNNRYVWLKNEHIGEESHTFGDRVRNNWKTDALLVASGATGVGLILSALCNLGIIIKKDILKK